MFGKEKCKMLKEIRAEIARNNDINLVIEECTHQGKCKGTCPACEAEVAYLEEQLEKRKALGKAVCVAGISAAMVTGVVQGQQMKNSRAISGVQGVYQQEPDMDQTMGVMPITPSPEVSRIPDRTMGDVWITESPEITSTPEMPMGTMAPPETTPPVVTAEPTPTSDFFTDEPTQTPILEDTSEPIESPTATPVLPMGTMAPPKTTPPVVTAEPTPTSDFYTNEPTTSPIVTDTPEPTGTPIVTDTPEPTASPIVTDTPEPKNSPTATPMLPMGTMAPKKTKSPVVTAEPTPTSDFYTDKPTVSPTENTQMKVENQELVAGANATASPVPETACYVTFVYNDGTIEQVVQNYKKEETLRDMPVLTRKGYSFGGWYTEPTGGNKVSAKDMVVQHTKLYAHWNKIRVKQTRITSVKRAGRNRINITWNKSSGVDGYRVLIATDPDMAKKKKILYVSKEQKKVTVPGIEGKTRYYISVVGYRKDSTDSKVYGKCQKIRKIIG